MSKTNLPNESIETYLIRRRALMRLGAMAGLGAALPGLRAQAQAKPATPLQFVGWQYNPQIVAQNVETFEQLYDENVNYQLIPGEYAPITETMLVAGKKFDMMYSEEATLARWITAGWAQDVDSMPDVAAIKASMVPVGVRNLSLPNGKLGGLPYYAGYGSFIYNEKHLDQAKLQPPTSWAEFLEQARQLKKDKIVEFPYVSAWAHQAPSFSWSLFSIWYSEGAKVFDANFDPVFDDKFTSVLEMHRTLYRERLVSPDIFTLPQEGVPSYATGQHTFAVIHDYDQKVLNDPKLSQCAGQVRNAIMPGATRSTFSWVSMYLMGAGAADPDRAWNLLRFFGGKAKDGQYHVIKRWALQFGLGTPYTEVMNDPEVAASFKSWKDTDVALQQLQNSTPRDVGKTLWYQDWDWYMMGAVQDYIRGSQPTSALVADLHKQVGVFKARYAT
ncbi:ABC transporter substrate-binding protein [Acidocella sp.]|uniref:ABC transporter substrate-binding protein n=1 Tax=Acidocella sp. TaxID=50710 RepID=UPI002F3E3FEC